MTSRLSQFNRRVAQHYWAVEELTENTIDGLPCFTRNEYWNFDYMRDDEIRWCFSARVEGVDITFPASWGAFRAQEEEKPNAEAAKEIGSQILNMLKGRK